MITWPSMNVLWTQCMWVSVCLAICSCSARPASPTAVKNFDTSISDYAMDHAYADVLKGAYQLHNGDPAQALVSYKKAAAKKESPLLELRLALLYARNVQFDQALASIDRVLKADPNSFEALELRGKIYAAQGLYPQAVQTFLDILALPEHAITFSEKQSTQLSMMIIFLETKNINQAKQLLDQMIAEDGQNPILYYYMGRIYTEKEQLKEARTAYEKTVALNPSFASAWKALVLLNDYFENPKASFEALEMVVQLDPNDIQARSTLIQRYIEAKNFSQVKKHQAYYAQRYEGDLVFCQQLLAFYYDHQLFEEALNVAQSCLAKNPGEDSLEFYQSLLEFRLGQKQKAKEGFEQILPASEFYDRAVFAQVVILEEKKDDHAIVSLFDKSIRRKSESVLLRQGYANYLIRSGQEDKAEKLLKKTIRQHPIDEGAKLSLAEMYEKQKKYDEMEALLRSILEADPYSSSALNFLGYSYADRGIRLGEAQTMIVQAMEISPDDGFIQDSLAWVYFRKKEYQKAKTIIEVALEREPQESTLWDHYGDILHAMKKNQQARQAYQRAIEHEKKQENIDRVQAKIDALDS